MSKLYIVEGPDCSGKTSLCMGISHIMGAAYMHASGDKCFHTCMLQYHMSIIRSAKKTLQNGISVVLDRLWPSEYVYGQVLRPSVSERFYDFPQIFEALKDLDVTYIFCGDDEVIERHRQQRDDDHPYSDSQFQVIVDAYKMLEEEMVSELPIPLLQGMPAKKFNVKHYSIKEHGQDPATFICANS